MSRAPVRARPPSFLFSLLVLLVVGAPSPSFAADPPIASRLDPVEAERGALVKVSGQGLPDKAAVLIDGVPVKRVLPTSDDHTTLSFWVPTEMDDGKGATTPLRAGEHPIRILAAADPSHEVAFGVPSSGRLRVLPDVTKPLDLTVQPEIVFPVDGQRKVTLEGDGISRVGEDNQLLLDGKQVPVCWRDPCTPGDARGTVDPSGRAISFTGLESWSGLHQLQLRREGAASASLPVTFAICSPGATKAYAALVVASVLGLLFGLVYLLSRRRSYDVNGHRYGFIGLLLIDPQNETLSLSRLQFYLWTGAAAFAYIYLYFVRALLQLRFDLPDVPPNVPGLMALSAGTGVAAVGITAAKGPSGSGSFLPSVSDFLESGGVVAPERFQFLLWTLLGVGGFLFGTFSPDPRHMTSLPGVPEGVLYLMGVSSVGYLGGKLVRKRGPVVDAIVPVSDDVIEVRGSGLSRDASVLVDGSDVAPLLQADLHGRPETFDPEPTDATFVKGLRLKLASPPAWLTDPKGTRPMVTIVNPDGQRAEHRLEAISLAAAGAEAISLAPPGTAAVPLAPAGTAN